MIRILFVCHGNICRSPMAEFVLKDMVKKLGIEEEFYITSAATSMEELGNPVHPGTRNKLREVGISCAGKYARQMNYGDYKENDYLVGMDKYNIENMYRLSNISRGEDSPRKIHLLLEFVGETAPIADPWYTHNFEDTYKDVVRGCKGFLRHLKEQGKLGKKVVI